MAKSKTVGEIEAVPPFAEYQQAEPAPAPKAATPVKADANGPLPRVVTPLTRAAEGTTRFKVSCHGHVKPAKYVLAAKDDQAGAESCYRDHMKLDDEMNRLKAMDTPHFDPRLVVVPLAD